MYRSSKIKKNTKKRRLRLFMLIALLILFMGVALTLKVIEKGKFEVDQAIVQDTKKEDEARKQEFIESTDSDGNPSSGVTVEQNKKIELSARREDGDVIVLTKLYGYGSGTCNLRSIGNGKSDVQDADIIYQNEFSSCLGFSVPIDNVGDGTWKITLTVKSGGKSEEKTISFEVT